MQNKIDTVRKRMFAAAVLATTALPITAYLVYAHFEGDASSFCNFSAEFNCEVVNKSIYSELFGIPVAIFGFLTYVALLVLATEIRKAVEPGKRGKLSPLLLNQIHASLAGVGTVFSLYLTYIEAFELKTWCIFCVTQQIIVFIILVLSLSSLRTMTRKKSEGQPEVCEFC